MKSQENNWDPYRNEGEKDQCDHIPGEHVGVETHCQREHASQMANDLDRDHDDRQPPHRAHKMIQVSYPVMSEAMSLIINKGEKGPSDRKTRHMMRRRKTLHQTTRI